MRLSCRFVLPLVIGILAWIVLSRMHHGSGRSLMPGKVGEVEVVKNLSYGEKGDGDPAWHKFDLYLPKGHQGFPVMLFIHGGSWVSGSKDEYEALGMAFARNGIGAVVINYRLSPKVKHPAHTQDAARAFAWIRRNIEKSGGRADQIFVCGHSAGGHIAALLGSDESYLKVENLSFADLRGTIPISGDYFIKPGRWNEVFGEGEEAVKRASPINVIDGLCPPFLLLYAEGDGPSVGKHSGELCEALRASGTEASSMEIKDRRHASIVRKLAEPDDVTMTMILGFINSHVGPEPSPKL